MSDSNITEQQETGSIDSVETLEKSKEFSSQEEVSLTTEQVVAILLQAVDSHKQYIQLLEQKVDALAQYTGNQARRIDILEAKTHDIVIPSEFITTLDMSVVLDTHTSLQLEG
jgi:hypothetical protein